MRRDTGAPAFAQPDVRILVSGLDNYTAIEYHLVEFVDSPEQVTTLNAQTTTVATTQLLGVIHSVRTVNPGRVPSCPTIPA